ncbi:MAG TPA: acetylornithine/succinylornithine family transaminase [Vicinamibacterales bacterium]|jgi:predicted acetylornithine/succinylornithine family transaminase
MTTGSVAAKNVMTVETDHVLQIYKRNPVVFERGRGCYLFDSDGRAYLDLLSGIGVAALGHAHPRLAAAIADQASTLLHTSNLYYHSLQGELATRLAALSGLPRAFFCNSGSEAIEACLKFSRRFWHAQKDSRRTGFVAFDHAFHGRTIGSLSITWDDHYRAPFAPLLAGVQFVPATDPDALRAAVTESTAAVILEPLQGEGGVRPFSQAMADAITDACRRTGALLIADEIQCGLGRTGRPFYSSALSLSPDLMAIGKALGAGVPIAAALFSERVAKAAAFGDHGSTYGGNLLACRAALVFLEELIDRNLIGHVATVGAHLERGLRAIASRYPIVREVRGAGLIWGLDLDRPALPVVEAALELGLLVNRTSETVVRLLPPYVITQAEVDQACSLLDRAIGRVAEAHSS